jgi:hypothetical protein
MKSSRQIICLLLLVLFIPEILLAEIKLSAKEWNFGTREANAPFEYTLSITNDGTSTENVEIISTCDCISAQPNALVIKPKQSLPVVLRFDPIGEEGEITKIFFINATGKQPTKIRFNVIGKLFAPGTQVGKTETPPADNGQTQGTVVPAGKEVNVTYYYTPGCKTCLKFLNETVPALEKKLNVKLVFDKKDITDPAVIMAYSAFVKQHNEKERALPALFIGNRLLQGNQEIDGNLEQAVKFAMQVPEQQILQGTNAPVTQGQDAFIDEVRQKVTIAYTITAGLLDGINPCAFTTIIFLITSLTLAGRRRTETLIMGIFFSAAVFVTYYLLALGLFEVIRTASMFAIISMIIRWGIVAVLIVFAGISLYDYYLIKKGKETEMILQLPTLFKKKIQTTIKSQVRSTALVTTSITLGFLVSLFELGCTGQILLPYVTALTFYKDISGFAYLFLYDFCFILPLLAVFILTYLGVSSKQVTGFFQKRMGLVKILFAVLFIFLAAVTLIFS